MSEHPNWLTAGAGRGHGVEIARDEPSHIHLPRRRRRTSPDAQGAGTTWPADVGEEGARAQDLTTGPDA
jgi:hypothetical protein